MKTKVVQALIAACITALLAMPSAAFALETTEQGNVLEFFSTLDEIPLVVNSDEYQVAKYKVGSSPNLSKGPYETKKNTIKAKKHKGMNYTFSTTMFLPTKIKKKGTYTVQNLVVLDKYVYVLYVNAKNNNKGFLVRYDYAKIKSMGLTKGKKLKLLRQSFYRKMVGKKLTATEKKIVKLIKIGPLFTVGHGQTLAYNQKTKELWMFMDLRDKSGAIIQTGYTTMERVNLTTMKPDKAYRFWMQNKSSSKYDTPYSLVFDSEGYGYFLRKKPDYFELYRMAIDGDTISVRFVQRFKYGPSKVKHIQSMSYNPYRDTINIITNGAMMSFPASRIGSLKASDFCYEVFNTNREFEAIQFDKKGYAYLLCSKGPEVLKSTKR